MKIILDISVIPNDIKKEGDVKDWVEYYKKEYNIDIVPIDTSKKNTQNSVSAYHQPFTILET